MMILLRVTIAFLILLLLPDWYIHKVYLKGFEKWKKTLYWTPSIFLLALLGIFITAQETLRDYFGIFLIIVLCIAVPKTFFMIFSLSVRSIEKLFRCRLPHEWIALFPSLGILGYVIYGAIYGKENFKVHEVTFFSPDLPEAFDGYRILQISDIHSGSWTGNSEGLQRAISLCNALQPDLTVFTGDLVNSRSDELFEFIPVFRQLSAKDGVYSILGNHDYGTYVRWNNEKERLDNIDSLIAYQNRMGWQMLLNEHRILHRKNDSIALVGVENSGRPPFPDKADLPKAMKGTEGMFKVLLSHDPTHWRREVLPRTDIQLMLAGHTHDMQISIFGFSVSQFIYPEHRGMYLENGRGLYVNIGLGYVLFPMRLGAWPEITILTLRKSN